MWTPGFDDQVYSTTYTTSLLQFTSHTKSLLLLVFSALGAHADWTWLGSPGLTAHYKCWLLLTHCWLVEVTLRLTVSQSVSLGVEPHLGLMTRYLLLFDNYGLAFVGRPLWREDGYVFCICCWPLPAQSFLGPSPLGLATVFYCLRFETSVFFASYDSQGHVGGIRPRHHTETVKYLQCQYIYNISILYVKLLNCKIK
jgi:hypothetical protein